jgi:hypothetical protein
VADETRRPLSLTHYCIPTALTSGPVSCLQPTAADFMTSCEDNGLGQLLRASARVSTGSPFSPCGKNPKSLALG